MYGWRQRKVLILPSHQIIYLHLICHNCTPGIKLKNGIHYVLKTLFWFEESTEVKWLWKLKCHLKRKFEQCLILLGSKKWNFQSKMEQLLIVLTNRAVAGGLCEPPSQCLTGYSLVFFPLGGLVGLQTFQMLIILAMLITLLDAVRK